MYRPSTRGVRLTFQTDKEFKKKQADEAKARKELAAKAAKGGPLVGGGIKKYIHPYVRRTNDKVGKEIVSCSLEVYEAFCSCCCRRIIYILPSCFHRSVLLSLLNHATSTR